MLFNTHRKAASSESDDSGEKSSSTSKVPLLMRNDFVFNMKGNVVFSFSIVCHEKNTAAREIYAKVQSTSAILPVNLMA